MIGAIVVTYNPDQTFYENLKQIAEQFDTIVVDNNSNNINYILKVCSDFNVKLIRNNRNLGIAAALNQGVKYWKKCSKRFILTFDQDTFISNSYREVLLDFISHYKEEEPWGIVNTRSCGYWEMDKNSLDAYNGDLNYRFVDEVISSGSLIPIEVFDHVGLFWEDLFIDQVDNEFCLRVINEGYKIVEIDKKMKVHALGHIREKNFLGIKFVTYNQAPIRYYYRTRNILLVSKKYKKLNKLWYKKRRTVLLKDLIKIFFEENKTKKIRLYFKGFYDGLTGRGIRWE